jgi:K+-transporting ATPase ATPase C chain
MLFAGARLTLRHPDLRGLRQQVEPALRAFWVLTTLTGIAFPLALTGLASALFSGQAGGSLITRDGAVVGALFIGQAFAGPGYFHPRPSAAGNGYTATASGGTNLGPANPKLRDGAREFADRFRRSNWVPPAAAVPIDAVTRSGSGLDSHIGIANAALQVSRVARERKLSEEAVRQLVAEHTQGRQLGFLGEPAVAVLPLNLALDRLAPRPRSIVQ